MIGELEGTRFGLDLSSADATGNYAVFSTIDPRVQALAQQQRFLEGQAAAVGLTQGALITLNTESGDILAYVAGCSYGAGSPGGTASVIDGLALSENVVVLGCERGISKAEVSRICQGLDTQVQAFLNRPLEFSRYPYVYLDATYLHGRDEARKQVISRAVIVAVGITATGQREVLGIEVGDSEDETFWTAFLRRLPERGLTGVQLVVSDAHAGIKKAIARCCQGCSWQRCRVHFARWRPFEWCNSGGPVTLSGG